MRTALAAALVFVATLLLYGSMLPVTPAIGDEAEAQTVPYILGIAHPTGFPLFTLAGWLFAHVVAFGTVAWRLDAFAALCSALCAAGVVLLAVAVGSGLVAATFAGLAFAFGTTVWNGALHVNAQVPSETLGVFALVAAVVYARSGDVRALVASCACSGFGMAVHPASLLIVPAIAVALFWQLRSLTLKTLICALAALVLPLSLYAYLPLRSTVVAAQRLDPAAAAPLYGAGNLDWDSDTTRTLHGFLDEVLGQDEHAGNVVARAANPGALPVAATTWLVLAERQYRRWVFVLAAAGVFALARADRRALSVLLAGALGGITFAYMYRLNAHVDRYVVVSFAIVSALAAASTRLELPRVPVKAVSIAAGIALAITAALAAIQDRPASALPVFSDGAAIIAAAQADTPNGAIVVAQWNDAAALGYGAFVEHALGTRTIVAAWPFEYSDRYEQWARSRPVYLFVSPLAARRSLPMWADLRESSATLPQYRVFVVVPPSDHRHRRPVPRS